MFRTVLAMLLAFALAACQQLPRPEAPSSPRAITSSAKLMQSAAAGANAPARVSRFTTAVVKDLVIEGSQSPAATRDELGALFGAAFRETLQREGYVRLALPGNSGADTATIQPATMRVSPSELEIAVAVRDARGRLLGWYAVQYRGASGDPRRMFADAGEQVAKAIATAR